MKADEPRCQVSATELSIVVPARNEAASVTGVLLLLRDQFPFAELILVDNASTDDTASRGATVPGVRVVTEPCPGKGRAMRTGAKAARGAFVLFHDADTEYEVRDAVPVVEGSMSTGHCVIGARVVAFDHLRWSSWLANRLVQVMLRARFGARVADVLSGTRCMRREDFLSLGTCSAGFGIETELAVACLRKSLALEHRYVRYTPRTGKQGKKIRAYHLLSLVRIAMA